jgi:PadR family transcriptional regulator PadR
MVAAARKLEPAFAGLRKGVLEFALLRMIGAEKIYVAEMLKRLSETAFATRAGTLYPLLGKLRRANLIDHEWRESTSGPPRKYYGLTRQGAQRLEALENFWARLSAELSALSHDR